MVELEVSEGQARWLAEFWLGAAGGPGSRKHQNVRTFLSHLIQPPASTQPDPAYPLRV